MQSNTTMSIKEYLMAILDNYMFRPSLAIFRLSSRELKVLLYTLCAHVVQRCLHTGLIVINIATKYTLIDTVVFDYIPFPIFIHTMGMTHFLD